jgi:glycosyltransferase involved in cell wall biosynthesis
MPFIDVQEIGPTRDGNSVRCIASQNFQGTIHMINSFRPDVVFVYGPINWIATWMDARMRTKNIWPHREIYYITVEADPLPRDFTVRFNHHYPDKILAPSQWSVDVLKKSHIEAEVFYHGIDFQEYSQKSEVDENKEKFTFGYVGRNDVRKGMQFLLKSITLVNDIPSDVFELYMTCPPVDFGLGTDLKSSGEAEFDRHDSKLNRIGEMNVKWCPLAAMGLVFPEVSMPSRYRSFDTHVFPSGGESFGLPVLEAAACGIPQILTALPVFTEIVGYDGALFVPSTNLWVQPWGDLHFPHPKDLAKAMEELYLNPEKAKKLAERAYETVRHKKLMSWDNKARELEMHLLG